MRTQEEIKAKFEQHHKVPFDFTPEILLDYFTFKDAEPYLKDDFKTKKDAESLWNKDKKDPSDRNTILEDMATYMHEFGWPKALGHRGLSASRTIQKMEAWLWLLGDEDTLDEVTKAPYENYGCPKLAIICNKYGLPIPDDQAAKNMMSGLHCGADYVCGCGT